MAYKLILGDRAYSSWSMRAWLLFERCGIPVDVRFVSLGEGTVAERLVAHPPARTVPTLVADDGSVICDSLAIAEELATRHPDAGLWPGSSRARAMSRSLAAEMHSGFAALRNGCPMNLRCAYEDYAPSEDVLNDLARIEAIWAHALDAFGGPWLCGAYSVADAFFAPVAARIAGYGLPVRSGSGSYVEAHLADPAFRRWRAMGLVDGPDLSRFARDHAQRAWPGPAPLPASAVESGPSENVKCPYSGRPVAHFLELEDRLFGFCNAFCRDKTVADPEAWHAFMELVQACQMPSNEERGTRVS